jgi:hypothetical protein
MMDESNMGVVCVWFDYYKHCGWKIDNDVKFIIMDKILDGEWWSYLNPWLSWIINVHDELIHELWKEQNRINPHLFWGHI